MNISKIHNELTNNGYCVVPKVFNNEKIQAAIEDYKLIKSYHRSIQLIKGMNSNSFEVCFHTITQLESHLNLFEENILSDYLYFYFEGSFILNTMSISELIPNSNIYTKNIHRDIRSFQGASKLWMQAIFLLTDSTKYNGSTWMLPKNKNIIDKPSTQYFNKNSIQVKGSKGDVILFDPNLWHCSGSNNTKNSRIIMTPVFSKPFIKQQFDYSSYFGLSFPKCNSKYLAQILGYNSKTPSSLFDWYQKYPNQRFYKPSQG